MPAHWGARYLRRMFLMMAAGFALLAIGLILGAPEDQ
jgi:hypothetical protein